MRPSSLARDDDTTEGLWGGAVGTASCKSQSGPVYGHAALWARRCSLYVNETIHHQFIFVNVFPPSSDTAVCRVAKNVITTMETTSKQNEPNQNKTEYVLKS